MMEKQKLFASKSFFFKAFFEADHSLKINSSPNKLSKDSLQGILEGLAQHLDWNSMILTSGFFQYSKKYYYSCIPFHLRSKLIDFLKSL